MRLRVVQPDFYDTEQIGALSWDARLVLIGLWSYVRDEGVGKDNVGQIIGTLYPFDAEKDYEGTRQRVSAALDELQAFGLIVRFEADGVRYIEITDWLSWQNPPRPSKKRYPTSAEVAGDTPERLMTVSADSPNALTKHLGPEYGNGSRSTEVGDGDRSAEFGGGSAEGEPLARTFRSQDAALRAPSMEEDEGIADAQTVEMCAWCGEAAQDPFCRPFCSTECENEERNQR